MTYERTDWVNGEKNALNATNLNNIEQGIVDAATQINILNSITCITGGTAPPNTENSQK